MGRKITLNGKTRINAYISCGYHITDIKKGTEITKIIVIIRVGILV